MQLSDYIKRENILVGLSAPDKTGALKALCRFAAERSGLPPLAVLDVVLTREKMGSTGIGFGVALPHGKSPLVEKPLVFLATAKEGINFDSLDGQPVRLFVMLLTPEEGRTEEHLQLLARLGALLKSREAVQEFLAAENSADLFQLILKRE